MGYGVSIMSKKKDTFTGNYYAALVAIGVGCLVFGGYMLFGLIALIFIWITGVFNEDE